MPQLLFGSVILGTLLLLIPTVWLVVQNWSPKILSPILSIILGGTVTSLITVWVVLKETSKEAQFVTSILYDPSTNFPHMVMGEFGVPQIRRHQELCSMSRPTEGEGPQTRITVTPPESADEKARFGEELLAYAIFEKFPTLYASHSITVTIGGDFPKAEVTPPAPPIAITKLNGKAFFEGAKHNRFSTPQRELMWHKLDFRLPRGATTKIESIQGDGQSAPYSQVILERPAFFTVTIAIHSMGGAGAPTRPPTGFQLVGASSDKCLPMFYRVEMKAIFHKLTSGNAETEQNQAWVEWLFARIRTEFADDP